MNVIILQIKDKNIFMLATPMVSFIFIEFLKSFFSQEPFAKSLQMNYFFLSIGEYAIL